MNNVSVRVMTPEEILEKITEEKNLKLSVKLAKSLSENGVVVSVFEDNFGEVQVCNVCVDFSEHDKKVTEEKDNRIEDLESYHQYASLEINRLNVALEVITEKYMKLREVHGL